MQTVKDYMKLSRANETKLKHDFMDSYQDSQFKSFVEQLPIEEELLIHYTSRLQDAAKEWNCCKNCSGLANCSNLINGYRLTPQKKIKTIIFSYTACPFKTQQEQESSYQKYVSLYNIPEEMKYAGFKNLYRDDKNRIPIIKYFKTFLDDYDEKDKALKGLYLHGSFGSGKTYLVAALLNELAKRNVQSAMVYFPEFLRQLKSSFNDDFEEKFDYIKRVPVLLLDDIGAENLTSWSRDEILGPILQYRMEHHLPTFFTSNFTLEELEYHLGNTTNGVDKVKARRIIERIKQLTVDLSLVSKNRRQ